MKKLNKHLPTKQLSFSPQPIDQHLGRLFKDHQLCGRRWIHCVDPDGAAGAVGVPQKVRLEPWRRRSRRSRMGKNWGFPQEMMVSMDDGVPPNHRKIPLKWMIWISRLGFSIMYHPAMGVPP